ncbi:MAG: hypothetical protein QJR01_08210 [Kyrpidia sp.]|nr:hypothetical protein [Kyrpidia sp.]
MTTTTTRMVPAATEHRERTREEGLADLHAHLLPGLDDGPASLKEALALLEELAGQGVRAVVCTPHMYDRRYRVTQEQARSAVSRLTEAAAKRGLRVDLYLGAEVRLTPESVDAWDAGMIPRDWGGGRYVLVELSMGAPPRDWLELAHELRVASGATPVLAHPERYPATVRDGALIETWVDRGGLCQVTWSSLLGLAGRGPKRRAIWMLERGLCHVMASDAHDLGRRAPHIQRSLAWVRRHGGESAVEALLANAWALLAGNPVEALRSIPWPSRRRTGWWF